MSPATSRTGKQLTEQQIIKAAIKIADEKDIDALTIRGLAAELGVGTMTLYGYFHGKGEILDGMANHILGGFSIPEIPANSSPKVVFCRLGAALLELMREHPSVIRLLSTRVTGSHVSMRGAVEALVARLRAAGFTGAGAVRAYGLLMVYTLGFASYQTPRPWARSDAPDVSELRRQRKHFYASLPRPDFENVVDFADAMVSVATDEQFRYGLERLVAGLLADPTSAGRSKPAASARRTTRTRRT